MNTNDKNVPCLNCGCLKGDHMDIKGSLKDCINCYRKYCTKFIPDNLRYLEWLVANKKDGFTIPV